MTAEAASQPSQASAGQNQDAPHAAQRRLYRSLAERKLAGICGGIAELYHADPTMVRLVAVVLGLLTGIVPMLVLYLVAAVVIPERPESELDHAFVPTPSADAGRGALVVGMILVLVGGLALANQVLRIDWNVLWPVALVMLGGLFILTAPQRS